MLAKENVLWYCPVILMKHDKSILFCHNVNILMNKIAFHEEITEVS